MLTSGIIHPHPDWYRQLGATRRGRYKKSYSHSKSNRSNQRGRKTKSQHFDFTWVGPLIIMAIIFISLINVSSYIISFIFRRFKHTHHLKRSTDRVYVDNEGGIVKSLSSTIGLSNSWPISVRNEEELFEVITHPADDEVSLKVPKFYVEMPLGEGKLMTKKIASMIGSYKDHEGQRSKSQDSRTIFVSIISYRNWKCRVTIESLYKRASYPDRIRVGVVDQIEEGIDTSCDVPLYNCEDDPNQALCKFHDRIDVYEMEASFAVGPMFARHIGNRLYRGEYYTLQIDSDVTFVTGWDVSLIEQHEATNNEMAILTTHLTDVEGSINEQTGTSLRSTRPIMCNTKFDGKGHEKYLRHFAQPETQAMITGSPQLEPFWAAALSFARGHFVINVPYDFYLPMAFQGEEISMGMRAFTYGYDFYAPEHSVCFHSYAVEQEGEAKDFLENADLYQGSEKESMSRLLGIIHMIPEEEMFSWRQDDMNKYGLGQVREVSKFYSIFGIHTNVKMTERHLCDFVSSGQMHNMFIPNLRSDGMGINYDKIKYRYHELAAIHE